MPERQKVAAPRAIGEHLPMIIRDQRPIRCAPTAGAPARRTVSFLPRVVAAASALAAGLAPGVGIAAQTPADSMCRLGAPSTTVLRASHPSAVAPARAVWLDGRTVRWPAQPAPRTGERYVLYASDSAALEVPLGVPVRGASRRVPLRLRVAPLPSAVAARTRHVADGVTFDVPLPLADRRALLRAQLRLVRESTDGRVLEVARLQPALALDALFAEAETINDFGARLGAASTRFRVWAPTAQRVIVCATEGAAPAVPRAHALTRDAATGAWTTRFGARLDGARYTYLVDVIAPGVGLVRNRITDPYALALTANSQDGVVVDLADPALAPLGWRTRRAPAPVRAATDLVVYELHVRDFSIGDSTVPAAHRGRYLAFTDTASQGMRHLRALADAGVTDLHLLPVFDIATIPERACRTPAVSGQGADSAAQAQVMAAAATDCFNWGYDPFHYTVPEGSYATSVDDTGARIREFRRMVQAIEEIGLRVGMDVVYNHTTQAGQHPQSVLDRLVPGYYQRLDSLGQVETSTCCSNTATEHRMMAKLMIESAVTWVQHYGITSFRFDLMGHQPRAAMERLQRAVNIAAGRHVPLIGEGWNFGEVADGRRFVQASQKSLGGSGIGTFSDRARDAVRGGGCCDSARDLVLRQGWINGLSYNANEAVHADSAARAASGRAALATAADLVRVGLAGSLRAYRMQTADGVTRPLADIPYAGTEPAGYVHAPGEVVNYVENHDNQTLFDVNVMKLPLATSREDRARVQHLASAIVLLSQGIAYVHAGQEILRSKSLDRNSFDSGDWFNPLDWSYRTNGFSRGLPPARDNRSSWPMMQPRLARADIAPSQTEIRWTRDAFLDLLRIRRSSPLFRLRTADEVARRLRFLNTGPTQEPTVLVGHLDGAGLDGVEHGELLYAINVDTVAHRVPLPEVQGRPFVLHPVLRREGAADVRAREAVWDAVAGALSVPARTVVVFERSP